MYRAERVLGGGNYIDFSAGLEEREGEDSASPFQKMGTKRLRRIKEKAEKKALREVHCVCVWCCDIICCCNALVLDSFVQQEEALREDRKRREALKEEERKQEEERERERKKLEVCAHIQWVYCCGGNVYGQCMFTL